MPNLGVIQPAFDNGGYADAGYEESDDYDNYEGQGADDAMFDPMQYVYGALNYGKKKYGIPTGDDQEMGFDDGGVVPTQAPEVEGVTGGGNGGRPGAIDPRQAMAYLAGDGAVSAEVVAALEQKIDPQGQMNPTQRASAAIGVAPTDEARFGLLQHYRTKFNAYAGATKAALQQGDMGEAAKNATMAMDAVPNGQRVQFAPAQGGLAMLSKPAFSRGGGRPQPQQSFDDGGEVEEEVQEGGGTAVEEGPPQPPPEPVVPADAPDVQVPQQEAQAGPAPMPQFSEAQPQPEVVPPETVLQMLMSGFDKIIESGGGHAGDAVRAVAAKISEPEGPSPFDSRRWGVIPQVAGNQAAPPTGYDEAVVREPEVAPAATPVTPPAAAAPVAAPVTPPEAPRGQEQRFRPAGAPAAAAPAPAAAGAVNPLANRPLASGFSPVSMMEGWERAPQSQALSPNAQRSVPGWNRQPGGGSGGNGVVPTGNGAQRPRAPEDRPYQPPRGQTYHPSGFDPNGAPAWGTKRVRGFGPGLREQTGDPSFMDPNFRHRGPQPVYPTTTGDGRVIPAEEAVRARREKPDEGAPRGDRYGPGVATRPMGVVPTSGRQSPEQQLEAQAQRLFPSTSQARERTEFINRGLSQLADRASKESVETIRGEKAKQGVIGAAARQERGLTVRQEMQAKDLEARETRDAAKAAAATEALDKKLAAAKDENEKKRVFMERKEVVRATMDSALKTNATNAGVLKEIMKNNPGKSPFELQKLLAPHMTKFGLGADDALDAAKTLMGINPHTGVYGGGGGSGGAGMRPPDSTGAAADRKIEPGATRQMKHTDGKVYNFIVGPDGNWYEESEYKKRYSR